MYYRCTNIISDVLSETIPCVGGTVTIYLDLYNTAHTSYVKKGIEYSVSYSPTFTLSNLMVSSKIYSVGTTSTGSYKYYYTAPTLYNNKWIMYYYRTNSTGAYSMSASYTNGTIYYYDISTSKKTSAGTNTSVVITKAFSSSSPLTFQYHKS